MCKTLKIYFLLFLNIFNSESAKILALYPIPSISHQLYFRSITMELLRRGHEVTVLTTDPAFQNGTAPKNIREIDVHDISYTNWKPFLEMPIGKSKHINYQLRLAYDRLCVILENIFKADVLKTKIKNKDESFDLLLYDGCVLACVIFSYIYKIPAIAINSLGALPGNLESVGSVVNEAYYPSTMSPVTADTQIERLQIVFRYCYNLFDLQWYYEKNQNEAVKKALGADMPDIRDLKGNINMMFINLYSAWDSHRPIPISFKHMGGLHSVPEKPLPENIKSYLKSSVNGVIYMSLGTNVKPSRLPQEKIRVLTKVFSELSYDVLWKWDSDTMPNKPTNVRIFKWLPQSDILKHPNVKLFITQGGLQSTEEAITAGVPLIGIPMLADQWFNTKKYARHNIGLQLNLDALTEDSLRDAIHNVVGNNTYYININKHRSLMQDQPQKALDQAVRWIEYIIRHGGSHLRAPAADVSWAEYVELELILVIIFVAASAVLAICLFVKFLVTSSGRLRNKVKNN